MSRRTVVLGVGCRRGTSVDHLREHARQVLSDHGLGWEDVAAISSVEAKRDEPGLRALAAEIGAPLHTHRAEWLGEQPVVTAPDPRVAAAVGTGSVAEAAVLADGAALLAPKHVRSASTVALGRLPEPPDDRRQEGG